MRSTWESLRYIRTSVLGHVLHRGGCAEARGNAERRVGSVEGAVLVEEHHRPVVAVRGEWGEESAGRLSLQRRKEKLAALVALQDEVDGCIADGAVAVKEDNGVTVRDL